MGMVPKKPTIPNNRLELVSWNTSQLCATIWIQLPMSEINIPNQYNRKFLIFNEENIYFKILGLLLFCISGRGF